MMGMQQKGVYGQPMMYNGHNGMSNNGQQVYYAGSPMNPTPQTPFDTAYGASLLPSHLLMGSPFVSTPGVRNSASQRGGHMGYAQHYMSTPAVNLLPVNGRRREHLNYGSTGLRESPYSITFKILPKGDDEYRTRSLLFSNLNPNIQFHEFLTKFGKFGRIESVYLIDLKQKSILLSFLTKDTCLDFYNSVLQKLSEFKRELRSKELTLNFVALKEVTSGPSLQDVKQEVLRRGATRSLALEFDHEITSQELTMNLDILGNSGPRYVVEAVDIVNADHPSKHFNKHYAVIHFISIAMALETIDYLQKQRQKLGIVKLVFAHTNSTASKSDFYNSSSSNLGSTSQNNSESSLSVHNDIQTIANKLKDVTLKEQTLTIVPADYSPTVIEEHQQHCAHISISKPLGLDGTVANGNASASPTPQELLIHERNPSISHENAISMMQSGGQGSAYSTPGYHYYMDVAKPLSHTLQQQFTTTAQVATAMGGGLGNRTVYIGNISPRSKAEDICNVVRGGILQSIKFIESKHICFVTFIEAAAAVQFFANSSIEPIVLHGNVLKVGWGHHSGDLPQSISLAATVGASRNVYVSLPEYAFKDKYIKDPEYQKFKEKFKLPSKEQLKKDFNTYGDIEQINFLDDGHCCWVNFMNITSAIRLVEDANNPTDNAKFHDKFQGRYNGLIIGYGKDRCGNVNKNLVANKNSKFFKKVKKASYNIRIQKQQKFDDKKAQKCYDSQNSKEPSDAVIEADAFGISIGEAGNRGEESDEEQRLEESELLRLSNANNNEEGLGISLAHDTPNDTFNVESKKAHSNTEDDVEFSSSASSDIDIIVSSPGDASNYGNAGKVHGIRSDVQNGHSHQTARRTAHNLNGFKGFSPMVSSTSLDAVPPLAPSTVSRQYSTATKQNSRRSSTGYVGEQSSQDKSTRNKNTHRRRKSKAIPGSDVMAQYLAQLQHSTFMYAANILGVDEDETVFYDENGPVREPI